MQKKYDKYEEEFSLFGLIWFWVSRWKSIVAVALVGLILGCGFVVATAPQSNTTESTEYEASIRYQMADDLSEFSSDRLDNLGDYVVDTKLLDIDAYDLYRGSITFKVQASQTELEAVYGALYAFLNNGEMYANVADATGLYSERDLASLVGCSAFRSNATGAVDADSLSSLTLAITVLGADEAEAKTLLQQVETQLGAYTAELQQVYNIVAFAVVDTSVVNATAKNLAEYQDELRNKYSAEKDKLKTHKAALSEALAAEDIPEATEAGIDKGDLVKYGGVGFGAGLILALLVWGLLYLFGDKLYAVDKMEERLQMKSLGTIYDTKKLNPIDRAIAQKRGDVYCALPVEEQRKVVLLNIKNELKKTAAIEKVYLVSSFGEKLAEAALLKTELAAAGYVVVGCSNVIGRADLLEQMNKTDAVVVLENKDFSKTSLMEAEVALLKEYVDNVLGFVVIGGKK